jgi:CubicO group peptidase (beta-lactamase class C family)
MSNSWIRDYFANLRIQAMIRQSTRQCNENNHSVAWRLLPIFLVALLIGPADDAWAAETTQQRIAKIMQGQQDLGDPGCATAIFDHHRRTTVFVGATDTVTRQPIDANTIFYAGSVSKQFTAIAITQLALAGKLRLDDDIRKWLPELPTYRAPITLRMLIHHVAGIRDVLGLLALEGYRDISMIGRLDALQALFRQQDTNFVPGTRFEYSNGGYLLLSEVVARASGKPFSTYINESILQPLGMTRSLMLDGTRLSDTNVAQGYVLEEGQLLARNNFPLFGGSGGLITTLNDLARYDDDVTYRRNVWTPEIAKILLATAYTANGKPVVRPSAGQYYVGGLIKGSKWIWHGGASAGFKALYARMPYRNLRIAMLCNRGEIDLIDRADAILKVLDPTLPLLSDRVVPPFNISGRYASNELTTIFDVTVDGDVISLVRRLQSGDTENMEPVKLARSSDGAFIGGGLRLIFEDDASSVVVEQSHILIRLYRTN